MNQMSGTQQFILGGLFAVAIIVIGVLGMVWTMPVAAPPQIMATETRGAVQAVVNTPVATLTNIPQISASSTGLTVALPTVIPTETLSPKQKATVESFQNAIATGNAELPDLTPMINGEINPTLKAAVEKKYGTPRPPAQVEKENLEFWATVHAQRTADAK